VELPGDEHEAAARHFRPILADKGHEVLGIRPIPARLVALRHFQITRRVVSSLLRGLLLVINREPA
jgi:hypothetical protein